MFIVFEVWNYWWRWFWKFCIYTNQVLFLSAPSSLYNFTHCLHYAAMSKSNKNLIAMTFSQSLNCYSKHAFLLSQKSERTFYAKGELYFLRTSTLTSINFNFDNEKFRQSFIDKIHDGQKTQRRFIVDKLAMFNSGRYSVWILIVWERKTISMSWTFKVEPPSN